MAKYRLPNTLGELAKLYGFSLDVLNAMIDQYEDLKTMVQPFRDGKKKIYPSSIIDAIKDKLGEP
ncbi:hypothetical protein ACFOW1_09555 [Parasediminibacterium paludis]|uniref:DNA-binding protein n=1 Tax=Parasediminibacterium paludis TaxID=908966 RepID=A0ABV8PZP1_9BACT